MATYNAGRYLDQQIESILNQTGVKVEIWVKDDGSTDGTFERLAQLEREGKIFSLTQSNRLGSSSVFFNLLEEVKDSDYYAFSDQDDIWKTSKLIKQIDLFKNDSPKLVITGRKLIDADGNPLRKRSKRVLIPSFSNALIENIAYGNTQVLNKSLRSVVLSGGNDFKFIDAWIYLVASAFAEVSRVDEDLVLYRIHGNNAVGLRKGGVRSRFQSILDFRDQSNRFNLTFKELPVWAKNDVEMFLESFSKKTLPERGIAMFRLNIRRQSYFETLIWKLMACLVRP
jgi:glycosyltransferase involved in cell wall biosynthesis